MQASEHKEIDGFLALRDDWSKELASKAEADATGGELADIALLLDDDGYTGLAKPLLEKAWQSLKDENKAVIEVKGNDGRRVQKVNPKFLDVVTRLGWTQYKRPAEVDECSRLNLDGTADFNREFMAVDPTFHETGMYPPEIAEKLEKLSKVCVDAIEALRALDAKDGFAIKAREAWVRFETSQNGGKVDRKKGKRSFSPMAMGREGEDVSDIWMYDYQKPFVVYLEKPSGAKLSKGQMDRTLILLSQLHEWFRVSMIEPFELKRVRPAHNADQAEKEGWPLEVVLFGERASFDAYLDATMGESLPGVTMYYSVFDERLVGCLPDTDNADILKFHLATMCHEACHLISDTYAVGPQFSLAEMQTRPRYSSVLVQEGLADWLSGVSVQGTGEKVQYTFGELNTARLKDFKMVNETLGNKLLFRLRDLPQCRSYRECVEKAIERQAAEKFKVNVNWLSQVATGTYYATACQAAYFFHHFKKDGKYVYRDKWWAFLKDEYQGKHTLKGNDDNAGIDAFKAAFEIEDDADWDTIEAEFLEFTLALETPEPEAPEED